MPYTPEDWTTRNSVDKALMEKIEKGIRDSLAHMGVVALDSFPGDDAGKYDAALTYLGAQTYKPSLVFSARSTDLRNAVVRPLPQGTRLHGPLGNNKATEFRLNNRVLTPAGGLIPVGTGKDCAIEGLSFQSLSNGKFLVPSSPSGSNGIYEDFTVVGCSFHGYGPDWFNGSFSRPEFQRWYVNSGTDTSMKIGGSDFTAWTTGGNFMSSAGNAADVPLIDTGALANGNMGSNFLTPQGGYGFNIPNPRQGFIMHGGKMTSTNREGLLQTQRAGIRIGASGGDGAIFNDTIIFAVNASGVDPGDITVLGNPASGHGGHIFNNPQFWHHAGSYVAPNLEGITAQTPARDIPPAIYTTVPIVVNKPVSNGGRPKVLRQKVAGLIDCNDPSWTIVTD